MRDLVEPVDNLRRSGTPAVLVRAVEVTGFGAGQYDNAVVRTREGVAAGAILRGVADAEVERAVQHVLNDPTGAPRTLRVGVDDPEAAACGLSCGGSALLVIEPLDVMPETFWGVLRSPRPVVVATLVEQGRHPATLAVDEDNTVGSLNGAELDEQVVAASRELLANPRANRASLQAARGRVLIEKLLPRTRLVSVGGGEVIDALTDVTRALGWLMEARPDGADTVALLRGAHPTDAVVVTSHDPEWGPAALAAALGSEAFFVGALGSRHTQQRRAERLAELGLAHEQVARIHGPVGLDLGGRTPAETALAICAEVLAVRSGRNPAALSDHSGSINS